MSKQTQQIHKTLDGHDLREIIESNVFVKNDGHRFIKIPNSRLDFSAEFVYLGFTKAGNPKFGEVVFSGPEGIKIQKRIGRFDGKYLSVMGGTFLKSIDEMREESFS